MTHSNVGVMSAGYLAGEIQGLSWENLVDSHIFIPLNMSRTLTDMNAVKNQGNYASPFEVFVFVFVFVFEKINK